LHKEQFSYHYSYYVPNYKGEKEKKKKKEDLTMAISGKAAQFSSSLEYRSHWHHLAQNHQCGHAPDAPELAAPRRGAVLVVVRPGGRRRRRFHDCIACIHRHMHARAFKRQTPWIAAPPHPQQVLGVGNKRNGGGRGTEGELTWVVGGGGPGAAADGQAAARGEPEHLVLGDVEVAEQLWVGEEAAEARHLRRRGVVHGGAARLRGVLGRLEVRRAGEQVLQALHVLRGHAVGGARRARGAAGQAGGGGGAGGGEDEDEEEEVDEERAPTHRRRRWRGTITGGHGRGVRVTMRGSGSWEICRAPPV